jgi:hypothetical protein
MNQQSRIGGALKFLVSLPNLLGDLLRSGAAPTASTARVSDGALSGPRAL